MFIHFLSLYTNSRTVWGGKSHLEKLLMVKDGRQPCGDMLPQLNESFSKIKGGIVIHCQVSRFVLTKLIMVMKV